MSTYSLDTDANTFDWNSSLAVQAKPPVFVSLSVCLWALLVCARLRLFTCVFNEDQRACSTSSVSSAHMRVGKFVCSMCRRVQCCCFFVFLFLTVWLTAAINRIKSKWARAPSRRLQSIIIAGERRKHTDSLLRLHLHDACMWSIDESVNVHAKKNQKKTNMKPQWDRGSVMTKCAWSVSLAVQLQHFCLCVAGGGAKDAYLFNLFVGKMCKGKLQKGKKS